MSHLFLFTISPVQAFIQQARKTQDLHAGSRMLSTLCKAGIDEMSKFGTPIYPNTDNDSLPNRFVGLIETNQKSAYQIGKQVQGAVEIAFQNLKDVAMQNLEKHARSKLRKPRGFDEQIGSHLQLFWVSVPLTDTGYQDAYAKLEQSLGALKNTRPFLPFTYQKEGTGELGRKCSIDGERNVKFYRMTPAEKRAGIKVLLDRKLHIPEEELTILDHKVPLRFLQTGEGLSAVSFVKRCYEMNDQINGFPSTARISLMQIEKHWANENALSGIYNKFKRSLAQIQSQADKDDQLFYEENLNEVYFQNHGLENHFSSLPELIKEQSNLRKVTDAWMRATYDRGFELTSYYAVLIFDGDNMGKCLQGKLLKSADLEKEPELLLSFHKILSLKLGIFARACYDYLRRPKGQAIYAGGDDFMGLVCLENLWQVLADLRKAFDLLVSDPICKKPDEDTAGIFPHIQENQKISFSAGLAIAHYKTPLNIVLNRARETEKGAKKVSFGGTSGKPSKNALGISVLKKSGESLETYMPWDCEGENVAGRIGQLVSALRSNFSSSFISQIYQEFSLFINPVDGAMINKVKLPMLQAELKRLLTRAYVGEDSQLSKEENTEKKKQALEEMLLNLSSLIRGKEGVMNFLHVLMIAEFVKRKTNGIQKQKE
ncbi:MAG: type III-B CRISPR-associated protein Cas10/Cmr2 [Bacteroidota bacterium]